METSMDFFLAQKSKPAQIYLLPVYVKRFLFQYYLGLWLFVTLK